MAELSQFIMDRITDKGRTLIVSSTQPTAGEPVGQGEARHVSVKLTGRGGGPDIELLLPTCNTHGGQLVDKDWIKLISNIVDQLDGLGK